jgi:hypothetical protein
VFGHGTSWSGVRSFLSTSLWIVPIPGDFDALLLPGDVMNPDTLRMEPKAVAFAKAFSTRDIPPEQAAADKVKAQVLKPG